MKIIIPARLGSKGFPLKNRELFKYTADLIPKKFIGSVFVTSDDEEILNLAINKYSFTILKRDDNISTDSASIKDVMINCIERFTFDSHESIAMLYLTYPTRKWEDVISAKSMFKKYYLKEAASSLLCKKEVKINPYLCLREHGGIYGRQLVDHDLYRRQDYPKCFEISHYISMFTASSIYSLNSNLYSNTTVFYPILDVIDVDFKKDINNLDGR